MQTKSMNTTCQTTFSFFNADNSITNSNENNKQQQQQQKYQSSTLKSHNQYRIKFLPCFPTSFSSLLSMNNQYKEQEQEYPAFLLSSVPSK